MFIQRPLDLNINPRLTSMEAFCLPCYRLSVISLTSLLSDLQIYAVTPVPDSVTVLQMDRVPDRIKSFYRVNNVRRFRYDRPFHKGPKDRDNEFKVRQEVLFPLILLLDTQWISSTHLLTATQLNLPLFIFLWMTRFTAFISSDSLQKPFLPCLSKIYISLSSFLWNLSDIFLVCLCFLSFPSLTVETSFLLQPSSWFSSLQHQTLCDSLTSLWRVLIHLFFTALLQFIKICRVFSEALWKFSQHGSFWLKFRWLINRILNIN